MLKTKFCLKNLDYNTFPKIIHGAGENQILEKIKNKKNIYKKNFNKKCGIVTVTNFSDVGCLEENLNLKQPFYKIIYENTNWEYHQKIILLNKNLHTIKEEYTLFCDSHDIIIINLKNIESILDFYECEMLFNGEFVFWPNVYSFLKTNKKEYTLPMCFKDDFEKKINKNKRSIMYLNSGCWLAKTKFLKKLFEFIMDNQHLFYYKFYDNKNNLTTQDQHVYRMALQEFYPKIQLDYFNIFCQTLKRFVWDPKINKNIDLFKNKKEFNYY